MRKKVPLTVTIDPEDLQIIKAFCAASGTTVSGLFSTYIAAMTKTIKATGWDRKKHHSKLDLIRFLGKGLTQQT